MTLKEREFGPDVVRVGAFCLLLWLHFFLRNGFYYEKDTGAALFIAVCFRPLFMCCVPLFLVLTGYLKCGKELRKGYYRSLYPILCSLLLLSVVFLLYKISYLKESHSAFYGICNFFDFKLVNYAWYIEMYIGVFMVSPFMNALWNYLAGGEAASSLAKRNHRLFLLTMIFITFVPATFNGLIHAGEDELGIFPGYFNGMYFLTYYLIGCYLKTYPCKGKKVWAWVIIAGGSIGSAVLNIMTRTDPANFYSGYEYKYNHLLTAALTVCLFILFNSARTEKAWVKKTAAAISGVVLEMYLISWLFDTNIYKFQLGKYGPAQYLPRGLAGTALVFAASFVTGWAVHQVSVRICRGITEKIDGFREKKSRDSALTKNAEQV